MLDKNNKNVKQILLIVKNKGYLTLEEIMQLTEQDAKFLENFARFLNKTPETVKIEASKHQILSKHLLEFIL
jgi:hypothetical protein